MRVQLLCAVAMLSTGVLTAQDDAPANYEPIVKRNLFGLVPVPVHNPADDVPAVPPPKILPNGIMTIFGKTQVLFKVQQPGASGQPAKEISYTLSEGDRQDEIEVQRIDVKGRIITFNNHGTIQHLEMVKAAAAPTPAPAPPGGAGMPAGVAGGAGGLPMAKPMPMASANTAGNINPQASAAGLGNRFGRNRPGTTGGTPGVGGGIANAATPQTAQNWTPPVNDRGIYQPGGGAPGEQLTHEQQIILIEAQRQKYLQEGNHNAAAILPPTPITRDLMNEGAGNQQ